MSRDLNLKLSSMPCWLIGLLVGVLLLSAVLGSFIFIQFRQQAYRAVTHSAAVLAESINPQRISTLRDAGSPEAVPEYARLWDQLADALALDKRLEWLAVVEPAGAGRGQRTLLEIRRDPMEAGIERWVDVRCADSCAGILSVPAETVADQAAKDWVIGCAGVTLPSEALPSVVVLAAVDVAPINRQALWAALPPGLIGGLLAVGIWLWFVCRRRILKGEKVLKQRVVVGDAVLALFVGVVLTVLVGVVSTRYYERQRQKEQQAIALSYQNEIIQSLLNVRDRGTRALAGLFVASDEVNARDFEHFGRHLDAFRGVTAWAWAEPVVGGELAALEASIRERDGLPDFHAWRMDADGDKIPVEYGLRHYPLVHAYPAHAHERIHGLDLYSRPRILNIIERALHERMPVATGLVPLFILEDRAPGIIVCDPVFAPEDPGDVLGFALAALPMTRLMTTAVPASAVMRVDLFMADGNGGWQLLGSTDADPPPLLRPMDGAADIRPFMAFGNTYAIRTRPTEQAWPSAVSHAGIVAGFFGLLVSACAAWIVFLIGRQRSSLETAVRERTRTLQESETRYEMLARQSHTYTWEIDLDGVFTYLNPTAEQIIGYTPEELVGRVNIFDLHPRDGREAFTRTSLETMHSADVMHDCENQMVAKGGHVVWVSSSGMPVMDGDRVVGYRGWDTDITDRKLAWDAFRDTERSLSQVFENIPSVAVQSYRIDGTVTYWNKASERLYGYTAAEALGASFLDMLIPPELKQQVRGDMKRMQESREPIPPAQLNLLRKDGSRVAVYSSHALVDIPGRPLQFYCLDVDLSEILRAREQLELLSTALDAAANLVVITDREGRIEWVNRAFTRTTGFTVEECRGRNPRDLIKSGKHSRTFYAKLWKVILSGKVWSGEMINRKKDGTLYPEEVTITPVKNNQGEIHHFIAIKRDLTEEKAKERHYLRAQRMESIGTLAGGIAHDLNNALQPIFIGVDLLREDTEAELREQHLDMIKNSARRSAAMVRQVLDFARGREGELTMLSLKHLVREVENLIKETFPKNIRLHVSLPATVFPVNGDSTQIHQVLVNLCVNARDAMPDGGDLEIELENIEHTVGDNGEKHTHWVKVVVRDNGCGIPPELVERIFDPFFTTKETGKGTGLGLSTTHAIIQGHGGYIEVDSKPGQGTRMEVFLPAVEEQASGMPDAGGSMESLRGQGEVILVVDDEQLVIQTVKKMLQNQGYDVLTAINGSAAVEVFKTHQDKIDLVIIDRVMPVMGSGAAVRELLNIKADLRVIQTSGLPVPEDALSEIKYFIYKPYTIHGLLNLVRQVLEDN